FSWPKMKDDCLRLVGQCSACLHNNNAKKGYHPLKAIHASLPGEHIALDLAQFPTSNQGNVYALVIVDVCSRFVFLRAIPNKEAATISNQLFDLFCLIGFPKIIQSDNGSEFVNSIVKTLTHRL